MRQCNTTRILACLFPTSDLPRMPLSPWLVRFSSLFLGIRLGSDAFKKFLGHRTPLSSGVRSIKFREKLAACSKGYCEGHSRHMFNRHAFQFHEGIYKTYGKVARIYGFFGVRRAG